MIDYLKRLWNAILGKDTIVEVEKEVIRDLSLNATDLVEARRSFPAKTYKPGVTLDEFAMSEGEQRVINWFANRIGKRPVQGR